MPYALRCGTYPGSLTQPCTYTTVGLPLPVQVAYSRCPPTSTMSSSEVGAAGAADGEPAVSGAAAREVSPAAWLQAASARTDAASAAAARRERADMADLL